MFVDKDLQFSAEQNVDTTVISENVVDLGAVGDAIGSEPWVVIRVTTAVTQSGSGTVTFSIITHDDAAFSGPTTLWTSAAIAKASLVAGYEIKVRLPQGCLQYVAVYYTCSEALTAGNFDAFMVLDPQTNKAS